MNEKTKKHPFILSDSDKSHNNVIRRKRAESRFRLYGFFSVFISLVFILVLFYSIFSKGIFAFLQTKILVELNIQKEFEKVKSEYPEVKDKDILQKINYRKITQESLKKVFPEAKRRAEIIQIYSLLARNAYLETQKRVEKNFHKRTIVENLKVWLPASSNIDMYFKGKISEDSGKISAVQKGLISKLKEEGKIAKFFNRTLFLEGDSREAESAGILGAITGSIFVIFISILFSLPIGLAAAIYLQEFAPRNKFVSVIELAINNLAAVPSIVFGLLGLALFLNFADLPRSSSLAGGLTLGMLVLPVIIVTSRNALASVPPSIRQAAVGLGASKMQVVFHHVLPLSLSGIMTGAILSVARALGETAPLLMIGMVAFIRDIPHNFTDPATALPVQIYIWSDLPEIGFVEKTSAGIIILLLFLVLANSLAVYLRKKFEYKW
jgi:phosphate transport system permease protein